MQKLSAKFRASHQEYNKKAAKLIDVIRIQQEWVSALLNQLQLSQRSAMVTRMHSRHCISLHNAVCLPYYGVELAVAL
jgi:hypothetical protein